MKKQILTDKLKSQPHILGMSNRTLGTAGFVAAALFLVWFTHLIGVNPVIAALLVCYAAYVKFLHRELNRRTHRLLHFVFLYVIVVFASYYILKQSESFLYLPFAVVPMLAALLFGDRIAAFFLTVICATTIGVFSKTPQVIQLLFLTSGMLSIILVFGARRRTTIINAGIMIGLAQALVVFLTYRMSWENPVKYAILVLNGLSCGIIVLGVLPIFEMLFGTITNIKLLELADFNNPILNRLMIEAPGTYHHSLIVGNLSEAACKAVGANALLARIGAYYHDIGKLTKPEYFTENQTIQANVHEELAPSMSKLVIMNHVKEGVELARRHHLAPVLIEFIQQHHGKSLVYFFYRRALENSEAHQEITEEGFRYPGPKPASKEAAIVLLADSVEAATRTIKEPTPSAIEETVHKIINNKFIDGQLDECDLTLQDLELIATVFIHILSGMYHTRIHYPEAKT